ncbi:peptidase M48 [Campylobacterota bacterium]|nr:peptidase M48 [Campylobacterota bacterium]
MALIWFLAALFLAHIFTAAAISVLQINYLKKHKNDTAVLLDQNAWSLAADYAIAKERLGIVSSFYSIALYIIWIVFALNFFDSAILIEQSYLKSAAIITIFFAINALLGLPFDYYNTFVLDQKFGFNKSNKKLFFTDFIKSFIITIAAAYIVSLIVAIIITSSQNWWIYSFIFLFALIVLLNLFFPLIRKLFDRFTPLDGTPIGEEIKSLLNSAGFSASGVYKIDASKRDTRLNAYFAGLGKNKRVALYDTLLEKLSTSEILAVLAHELGHFKHNDIYKQMAILGFALFLILALFGHIDYGIFSSIGLPNSPVTLMVVFLIFSAPLFFFIEPFFNMLSRSAEFAADAYSAKLTNQNDLKSALIKLVTENRAFPRKHSLYALWHESHPNILERIEKLNGDR